MTIDNNKTWKDIGLCTVALFPPLWLFRPICFTIIDDYMVSCILFFELSMFCFPVFVTHVFGNSIVKTV